MESSKDPQAQNTVVGVTGATGYIASHVILQLLQVLQIFWYLLLQNTMLYIDLLFVVFGTMISIFKQNL